MNITVNGTANFYVGNAPGAAPAAKPVVDVVTQPHGDKVLPGAEKKLKFDPKYSERRGYSSTFLAG